MSADELIRFNMPFHAQSQCKRIFISISSSNSNHNSF